MANLENIKCALDLLDCVIVYNKFNKIMFSYDDEGVVSYFILENIESYLAVEWVETKSANFLADSTNMGNVYCKVIIQKNFTASEIIEFLSDYIKHPKFTYLKKMNSEIARLKSLYTDDELWYLSKMLD